MPFLAIDKEGQEVIYEFDPDRIHCKIQYNIIPLKKGTIKKLIGRVLQENEPPYEYKD